LCHDDTDRRLDAMNARSDAIQIRQRGNDANRPMPAHSQITHAVEKNHSSQAPLINRCAQQRAHDRIRTARLIHDRATKVVMFISEALDSGRKRTVTEVRRAVDNYARRLATGV
jgi:hypothetical protein